MLDGALQPTDTVVAVKRETVTSVGAEGTVAGTCWASALAELELVVTVTLTSYCVPLTRPVTVRVVLVVVPAEIQLPPPVRVNTS